ncbi:unnamed protein product [Dicrocoelium dendriticum]|nr:unnamed protein product [Dicrocoelium dendriticum]
MLVSNTYSLVLCYFVVFYPGPYYKYRTFSDFATTPIVSREASAEHLVQRLQEAPLFGVAYLILSHFYTVDYVRLEEFNERNFSYRFAYMIIIFFVFRLRVYFAWKMAECVCIASGLGAYPPESAPVVGEGPTDLKAFDKWMTKNISTPCPASKTAESNTRLVNSLHTINSNGGVGLASPIVVHETIDYTTITNISVWGCEFTTTVREGMRSWNQTVQYWLAFNFFKRCYGSRAMRYIWTMLVSAYWHGLYPGYYLSFLTIPLAMVAESELAVVICSCGRGLPSGSLSFFSWILKMRVFEYCCMGFLLLDAEGTLAYWHSIGYCVHVLLVMIIVLGVVLRRLCPDAAAAAAAAAASSVLRTVPTATERLDTASESKVYP